MLAIATEASVGSQEELCRIGVKWQIGRFMCEYLRFILSLNIP